MVEVKISREPESMLVTLAGSIEESTNFAELIGQVSKWLEIDTSQIQRINSIGTRSWIKYFQSLKSEGTELIFSNCSPAIVQQLNLISNFACGGRVESIVLPYSCPSCLKEFFAAFFTDVIKTRNFEVPAAKCPICDSSLVFDDDHEEYFHFLDIYRK